MESAPLLDLRYPTSIPAWALSYHWAPLKIMNAPVAAQIQVRGEVGVARMIRVVESPYLIGRSETAALSLPEDTMLSRLHFAFEYVDGGWAVRD